MNFIEACRKLIALDSTPNHGNVEVCEFLGRVCEELGFKVTYQAETLNGLEQINLIVRPQDHLPHEEFMLQTHLDTVDAGNFALWTKTKANPFDAAIYGDRIVGLGAADTKLDILCKIEAAKEFLKSPMRTPFVIVGTFGAQSSMAGAVKLMRRKAINAKRALIGEPTQLQLVHAGPGMAVVEVSVPFSEEEIDYRTRHDYLESASSQSKLFAGRAAHSSDPNMGENAIVKMLDYLEQLPNGTAVMDLDGGVSYNSVPSSAVLEIDLVGAFKDPIVPKLAKVMRAVRQLNEKFKAVFDPGFEPPHPTMNLGLIRTFDDQVRLLGSCRLPPAVTDAVYEAWMAEMREACAAVSAGFRVRDYKKSFHTDPKTKLANSCRQILANMGRPSELRKTAVSTEASVFSRLGIECLVFGPGQSIGNSHAPNESVSLAELELATAFYRQVIEKECV